MYIPPTDATPEVDLNFADGSGFIRGRFAVAQAEPFFAKIISHLQNILTDTTRSNLTVEIFLQEIPTTLYPQLKKMFDLIAVNNQPSQRMSVVFKYPKGWVQMERFIRSLENEQYNFVKGLAVDQFGGAPFC